MRQNGGFQNFLGFFFFFLPEELHADHPYMKADISMGDFYQFLIDLLLSD